MVPIIPFDDDDEAVVMANDTRTASPPPPGPPISAVPTDSPKACKRALFVELPVGVRPRRAVRRLQAIRLGAMSSAAIDHVREVAVDPFAFLRECTPGYFNNDGEEVTDDEGVLQPRSYAGELYGLGFYAFETLLADWRSKNDLSGLMVGS